MSEHEREEVYLADTTPRLANRELTLVDLSDFQREIVGILARRGETYGLAIKRDLETLYGESVNHGRLYPNLDTLVETGHVEKSELDKRTNGYALTDAGMAAAIGHARRWRRLTDTPLINGGDSA